MKTVNGITISDVTWDMINSGGRFRISLPGDQIMNCTNCNGGGKVVVTAILGGPFEGSPPSGIKTAYIDGLWYKIEDFSHPCPICQPDSARDLVPTMMRDSGLEASEQDWRLDYIDDMEGKDTALQHARGLLSLTPKPKGIMTFFGDYGTGKSGILKALTASFIRAGVKATYARANDILVRLRGSMNNKSEASEESILNNFMRYRFLAIDEIDRISDTDWSRSTIFTLLDRRYDARSNRATALVTNEFPDKMPPEWGYLMSRMQDGVRVPVGGASLRGGQQGDLIL
jgi:hypothetical protein